MKVNIQQLHGKHIKTENTRALDRQTQIVSEPIPQVVFRDIADNILPDFIVKAVSYLWQDTTCIHSPCTHTHTPHEQGKKQNPNKMAVFCSCNQTLLELY